MEELRSLPGATQRLATARSCYHLGEEEKVGDGIIEVQVSWWELELWRRPTHGWRPWEEIPLESSFFLPSYLLFIGQTQL